MLYTLKVKAYHIGFCIPEWPAENKETQRKQNKWRQQQKNVKKSFILIKLISLYLKNLQNNKQLKNFTCN